jgi:hypothetical protein
MNLSTLMSAFPNGRHCEFVASFEAMVLMPGAGQRRHGLITTVD